MTLVVDRQAGDDRPEGVVHCDAEAVDDCLTFADLGEHRDWSDEQFADAAREDGWVFDPRQQRWRCPACQRDNEQRQHPPVLAREGSFESFGRPRPQRGDPAGG